MHGKAWTENFNGMLSSSSSSATHVNEISLLNEDDEELLHQSLPRSTSLDARSVTKLKIYGASISFFPLLSIFLFNSPVKNFCNHFLNYGINSISGFLISYRNRLLFNPRRKINLIFFGRENIYRHIPAERRWMGISFQHNRARNVPVTRWKKLISSIFHDASPFARRIVLWRFSSEARFKCRRTSLAMKCWKRR